MGDNFSSNTCTSSLYSEFVASLHKFFILCFKCFVYRIILRCSHDTVSLNTDLSYSCPFTLSKKHCVCSILFLPGPTAVLGTSSCTVRNTVRPNQIEKFGRIRPRPAAAYCFICMMVDAYLHLTNVCVACCLHLISQRRKF
jgi:hypothetical protein